MRCFAFGEGRGAGREELIEGVVVRVEVSEDAMRRLGGLLGLEESGSSMRWI